MKLYQTNVYELKMFSRYFTCVNGDIRLSGNLINMYNDTLFGNLRPYARIHTCNRKEVWSDQQSKCLTTWRYAMLRRIQQATYINILSTYMLFLVGIYNNNKKHVTLNKIYFRETNITCSHFKTVNRSVEK